MAEEYAMIARLFVFNVISSNIVFQQTIEKRSPGSGCRAKTGDASKA
jgi:hypothetical protein